MVCRLASLVLLASLASPARAAADFRVEWAPGAVCEEPARVAERVRALLSAPPRRRWVARVDLTDHGTELVASLELTAGTHRERRRLSDPRCEPLIEALAAIVALSIDAVEQRTEPVPEPEPEPEVGLATSDGSPLGLDLGVGGRALVGPMPGPSAGIDVHARLRWDALRVGFRLSAFPRAEARRADNAGAGGRFAGAELGLLVCAAQREDALELALCGQVALGLVSAEGFGIARPGSAVGPIVSLGPAAWIGWWPDDVIGVALDLGVSASPIEARYVLEGIGPVHVASGPELRGGVSLWVRSIP